MRIRGSAIVTLSFVGIFGANAWAERLVVNTGNEPTHVTLTIIESKATGNTLEVHYRITNDSRQDVWVCESILSWPSAAADFEVYLPKDSETLTICRKLNIPGSWNMDLATVPYASYLRLPAGKQRFESIILPLPIHPVRLTFDVAHPEDISYATRLLIEIGFYQCNLPERTLEVLSESPQMLTRQNEFVRDRDRNVIVPHARRYAEDERTLSVVADIPCVPCVGETWASHVGESKPPDFAGCTRVRIEYHPSMLDYFFPGPAEQSLFGQAEREYLESQRTTLVDRPEQTAALRHDIERGGWSLIVVEDTRAEVGCYANDRLLTSFTVFGDRRLLTNDILHFTYGRPLESLRALAAQVQPYELRVQCARNLKNLWYRFRLSNRDKDVPAGGSPGKRGIEYPAAARWTDGLIEAYWSTGVEDPTKAPYRCPSAGAGRCHYAMNPDCEPNSSPDTVLLFETKAGWNQHGGPELFALDNHDPRGGLVLLNDGTVRFIRTDEELKQLRWK